MKWRLHILVFAALSVMLTGCFRDGFQCTADTDCFDSEACRAGQCVADTATTNNEECRPASDEQLCSAAEPCQTNLEVTDACGTLRQVTCECDDPCVPETVNTLCEAAEATCGGIIATDNCGDTRTVMCGLCTAPDSCVENACTPCTPPVCPDTAQCGVATNPCGESLNCGGDCGTGEICVDFACSEPVLAPAELATGDRFGEMIKLDGDFLLVGAPYTDIENLTDVGVIYVFKRDDAGWRQVQTLENPIALDGQLFGDVFDARAGRLLARTGNFIVSYARNEQGRYEFQEGTSREAASSITLLENDAFLVGLDEPNSQGETLMHGVCERGRCAVESGWIPPGQSNDPEGLGLGAALDSAGPYAIVGAPSDNLSEDQEALAEGSYYILSPSSLSGAWLPTEWMPSLANFLYEDYRDYPPTSQPTGVGTSVAVTEDGFAIAGAPFSDLPLAERNVGQILMLMPSPSELFDLQNRYTGIGVVDNYQCGYAVALTGTFDDKMAILSCVYDWPRARSDEITTTLKDRTVGDIRRYRVNHATQGWNLNSIPVSPPNGQFFDHFGWSIEASQSQVFVGAPGRNEDRGEVYIYSLDELSQ